MLSREEEGRDLICNTIVCRYPGRVVVLSVLVTLLSSIGLLTFREEAEMTALWVPEGSKFRDDFEWVSENFPKQLRSVDVESYHY